MVRLNPNTLNKGNTTNRLPSIIIINVNSEAHKFKIKIFRLKIYVIIVQVLTINKVCTIGVAFKITFEINAILAKKRIGKTVCLKGIYKPRKDSEVLYMI